MPTSHSLPNHITNMSIHAQLIHSLRDFIFLALLLSSPAQAQDDTSRRALLERRAVRNLVHGASFANSTYSATDHTTSTAESSVSFYTPTTGSNQGTYTSSPSIPISATVTTASTERPWLDTVDDVATSEAQPTLSITSSICEGIATFTGSVPSHIFTVFETVTEGYVVLAANTSVPIIAPTIFVTPTACDTTVVPLRESMLSYVSYTDPLLTPGPTSANKTSASGASPSHSVTGISRSPSHTPQGATGTANLDDIPFATGSPDDSRLTSLVSSVVESYSTPKYSSATYTSTVTVTKKTPVPVTMGQNPTPPPVFQTPSPNTPQESSPPLTAAQYSAQPGSPIVGFTNPPPESTPIGGNPTHTTSPQVGKTAGSASIPKTSTGGPFGGNDGRSSQAPANMLGQPIPASPAPTTNTNDFLVSGPATTTKLGNVIASLLNSPHGLVFTTFTNTRSSREDIGGMTQAPVPLTTTIADIPIVILPSSGVVIGGQTFALPIEPKTTIVQVGEATFTIGPSQIIAPGTTYTMPSLREQQALATAGPVASSVVTVDGLTFTIGPSLAVISKTTYRVGVGASSTKVTVDGTTISIGSSGIVLPGTTITPPAIDVTAAPTVTVSAGGLVFEIDSSEAVISGTTYRMGSGAPQKTIAVDGTLVSLGPGGVGLKTTTVLPPTRSTAQTHSSSGSSNTSVMQTARASGSAILQSESNAGRSLVLMMRFLLLPVFASLLQLY